ncbi:MAG TPA: K(+)-transporting ATPase subunit F [Actinomycetota bacterium]|jgi:K+-transporting ATPase KdpF subunit|nr:K(+)-transporting ATPase subunit F [Actinomycetota bacterium]
MRVSDVLELLVSLGMLAYLTYALIRPERF